MVDNGGQRDGTDQVIDVDAHGNDADAPAPPDSPKTRRLTSEVWKDFELVKVKGGNKARCMHCRKCYVAGPDKGTSHLKKHLFRCVKRNKRAIGQQMVIATKNAADETTPVENFKFDLETSRIDFAKAVIKHNYPFNMAEHEYFEIFVNRLQPMFKLVSRNTLRSDIMKVHKKEKEKMCKYFERFPGRVTLTTDIWTSDHQDIGYICLTSHFIGEDWELKKKILAYRCIEYPHDAETLFRYITDMILDWNLEKKLFSMVVDNASVNDAMAKKLRSWLCDKSFIPLEGQLLHVRCSAHILNLIVQDGLKVIGDFIFKVRETVKYLKRSGFATQKFNHAKNQLKFKDKKKVILDCPTRWNSMFLMIQRALEMKEVFWRLAQTDRSYLFYPKDEEWEVAKVICACLGLFYDATNHFSGSSFPTSNVFFPDICKIKLQISKWERSEHDFLRLMVFPMKLKFDKYWDECSLVLAIAVVFDPRFKMHLVEYYYGELHGVDVDEHVKKVRNAVFDLFNEYDEEAVAIEEEPSQEVTNFVNENMAASKEDELSGFDSWYVRGKSVDIIVQKKSELEEYLEEPLFPRAEPFNILNWWKINSARFPTLARMARDLLAIPATTVASEAAFSVGGRILDEARASMLPETVEALVTTKDWLPLRKRKRAGAASFEEPEVPK